jgi:phosphoserine phosphatase
MSFDIVCFDCDSTLSRIEGIDELARRHGCFEQVAALTDRAMNGELALDQVYAQRLDMIRPDRAAIDWLAQLYIDELVEGVQQTIAALQQRQIPIHIISGGLRPAILPLAAKLGIAEQQVHAVDVEFDQQGRYIDFVRHSPLASNGGKTRICRRLRMQYRNLALVGDGQTDLEAKEAGAYVIGFGGVADRPAVRAQADAFVDGASLVGVLDYLL